MPSLRPPRAALHLFVHVNLIPVVQIFRMSIHGSTALRAGASPDDAGRLRSNAIHEWLLAERRAGALSAARGGSSLRRSSMSGGHARRVDAAGSGACDGADRAQLKQIVRTQAGRSRELDPLFLPSTPSSAASTMGCGGTPSGRAAAAHARRLQRRLRGQGAERGHRGPAQEGPHADEVRVPRAAALLTPQE